MSNAATFELTHRRARVTVLDGYNAVSASGVPSSFVDSPGFSSMTRIDTGKYSVKLTDGWTHLVGLPTLQFQPSADMAPLVCMFSWHSIGVVNGTKEMQFQFLNSSGTPTDITVSGWFWTHCLVQNQLARP